MYVIYDPSMGGQRCGNKRKGGGGGGEKRGREVESPRGWESGAIGKRKTKAQRDGKHHGRRQELRLQGTGSG